MLANKMLNKIKKGNVKKFYKSGIWKNKRKQILRNINEIFMIGGRGYRKRGATNIKKYSKEKGLTQRI